MNIIKIILVTLITTVHTFVNIYNRPILKGPKYNRPILNNKFKTSLKCNYLENLENASYYERKVPKLLPKPIPIISNSSLLKNTKNYEKNETKIIPIPILTFDELFIKLFSVKTVYISSNSDRIIVEYNNSRGVFYISNFIERNKIEYLLSLIDADITIVNDYPTKMDYPNGELYCSPNFSMKANITEAEIEDIINGIIHRYEEGDVSDDDSDDDLGRMI
jgi:hypothetical protein